jgi:uncharacterized protein DUF6404
MGVIYQISQSLVRQTGAAIMKEEGHSERLRQRLLETLWQKGVSNTSAAPLIFSLIWKLGIALPPPHFGGFMANSAIFGIPFGVVWTGLMWLMLPELFVFGWRGAVLMALSAGIFFGLSMALMYRCQARRLNLSSPSLS